MKVLSDLHSRRPALSHMGSNSDFGDRLVLFCWIVGFELNVSTDYETDAVIQRSLCTELGKDVTLLTVAHRLQTVMDADRIVSNESCCSLSRHRTDQMTDEQDGPGRRTNCT